MNLTPEALLLRDVGVKMTHEEEVARLKGEQFNIFSILKMEYRENETHSAFIGELLNPKGSHLMGALFLKHFLKTIGHSSLDADTARVVLEEVIGKRNDVLWEGGRVDIYMADATGNTICIENKIAAIDQATQIQRYVNHNRGNNTVYYLTLDGKPASGESAGDYQDHEHYYFRISYKVTIIDWLQLCLKEVAEWPLLRESIRHYIILLKKITNQMTDHKTESDIANLIRANYSAAKVIQDNVELVEQRAAPLFLAAVRDKIKTELPEAEGWHFSVDENVNSSWKGLRVGNDRWHGLQMILMGAPKLLNSAALFGVTFEQSNWSKEEFTNRLSRVFQSGYKINRHWVYYQYYTLFDTPEATAKLFDSAGRQELIVKVTKLFVNVGRSCDGALLERT